MKQRERVLHDASAMIRGMEINPNQKSTAERIDHAVVELKEVSNSLSALTRMIEDHFKPTRPREVQTQSDFGDLPIQVVDAPSVNSLYLVQ